MCPTPDDPPQPPDAAADTASSGAFFRPSLTEGMLDRYMLGAVRPDEAAQAQEFFDDPARRQRLRQLHAWVDGEHAPPPPDRITTRAELWERIGRIGGEGRGTWLKNGTFPSERLRAHTANQPFKVSRAFRTIASSSAVILGLVLVAIVGHQRMPASPSSSRVYATAAGERATLTLRDGTQIVLAPRTTLTVDGDYGTTRRVTLNGEAYFTVVAKAPTPFVVLAGHTTTRVLGTSFDVTHYRGDSAVRIMVTSGRVQTQITGRPPVMLQSGMIGRMTDSTTTLTSGEDVVSRIGWSTGRLQLRDTPVSDLLGTLERWYGIRFQLADSSLGHERLNGQITCGTTANILTKLRAMLGVTTTVTQKGDTTIVTLSARSSLSGNSPIRYEQKHFLSPTEIGR